MRAVIVAGLRTPFVKRMTTLQHLAARDLGALVVRELVERTGIDPMHVERVVFGSVAPDLTGPNIAREVVLESGLGPRIDAYSITRACATSYQTTLSLANAIAVGDVACGIAGGADSASDVPIAVSKPLARALIALQRARTLGDRLRALRGISLRDLRPEPPSLIERSTGLSMGESAEKMARLNGITRAAQDACAHQSHIRAAAAWADGRFAEEVMPVETPRGTLRRDNMVRADSTIEHLASLRPVFADDAGTITAGNSSPLTDGASAVMLMREDLAQALGLEPLGWIVSQSSVAIDPAGQMLMGPAYAAPIALDRAGDRLDDMELIDLHEAFAAQVLSVLQAFGSRGFAERELGRGEALGEVNPARLNVMGGSIAIGHPFAATGTRQITQVLGELRRRGGGRALCAACAAGGLATAIVLESPG